MVTTTAPRVSRPECRAGGVPVVARRCVAHELTISQDGIVVVQQRFRIIEFELHETAVETGFLLGEQRVASDKTPRLVPCDCKRQACLERRVFVGDVVAPVAVTLFES